MKKILHKLFLEIPNGIDKKNVVIVAREDNEKVNRFILYAGQIIGNKKNTGKIIKKDRINQKIYEDDYKPYLKNIEIISKSDTDILSKLI